MQQVIQDLQQETNSRLGFSFQQGVLYQGRLVLATNSTLIPDMLAKFHSSLLGGHLGFLRTYRRVAGNLFWFRMKKAVQDFVKSVPTQKYSASSLVGLLQPLLIPYLIWKDIFITGLPKLKEYDVIFAVVDRLSKYGHLYF